MCCCPGYRNEIPQHHHRDSPSSRVGCGPCVLSGQHGCGCGKFGTKRPQVQILSPRPGASPDSFPSGVNPGVRGGEYARLRRSTHVLTRPRSLMEPLSRSLSYRDAAKIVRHRVPGQVGVNAHRSWFQVTAVSCVAGFLSFSHNSREPNVFAAAWFRGLLAAVPNALVGVDRAGVIRFVNGQASRCSAVPATTYSGQPIEMLVPESVRSVHAAHREGCFAPRGRRPGLDGDEVMDQNRVVSLACLRGRQRTTPVPGERHLVPHWHRGRPSGHCGRAGHDQSQEVKPETRPNIISLDGNQTDFRGDSPSIGIGRTEG